MEIRPHKTYFAIINIILFCTHTYTHFVSKIFCILHFKIYNSHTYTHGKHRQNETKVINGNNMQRTLKSKYVLMFRVRGRVKKTHNNHYIVYRVNAIYCRLGNDCIKCVYFELGFFYYFTNFITPLIKL